MLNFQEMMTPIWDSDMIYGESLMMLQDENGVVKGRLLFPPTGPVEIWDGSYSTKYEEGVDYIVEGDTITLTPNTRIFYFKQEELYPKELIPGGSFPGRGCNILWAEGDFFLHRQIEVTYPCKRGQWEGPVPPSAKEKLPLTCHRLAQKEPFKMMVFGDSISQGFNTSRRFYAPPFQGDYGELVNESLHRHFGSIIQHINTSIAGQETNFAIRFIDRLVTDYAPDLLILGFGMNDSDKEPAEFRNNIETIIRLVREKKSTTEFILVATSLPNPLLQDETPLKLAHRIAYKEEMDQIVANTPGTIVADITGVQLYMQQKKRYIDITGNHVNHPNDFFHRVYAQFISGMFL